MTRVTEYFGTKFSNNDVCFFSKKGRDIYERYINVINPLDLIGIVDYSAFRVVVTKTLFRKTKVFLVQMAREY